jgi:hypothetical protein
MNDLLAFLHAHDMKETEACVRREHVTCVDRISTNNDILSLELSMTINDYFVIYSCLSQFIFRSTNKIELVQFLFPMFVHFYLTMIEHDFIDESEQFYQRFIHEHTIEMLHKEYFYQLKLISSSSKHRDRYCWTHSLLASRFFLRLSMASCTEMQSFIDSIRTRIQSNVNADLTSTQIARLLVVFQQYLKVDIDKSTCSSKNIVRFRTDEQSMTPLCVHNDVANTIQFTRLYTGVFPLQTMSNDANRLSGTLTFDIELFCSSNMFDH